MIITDSYFSIGTSHLVCEDYATHGLIPEKRTSVKTDIHYGILSDGCSSQLDTDIGARLLVKNFEHLLIAQNTKQKEKDKSSASTSLDINTISPSLITFIDNTRVKTSAFINTSVLDCTFLNFIIVNNKCYMTITGDGCLFLQRNDETIEIYIIDYEHNAPVYLNHTAGKLRECYKKKYGDWKCIVTEYLYAKNKTTYKNDLQLEDDLNLGIPLFTKDINFDHYKYIMMCSDGCLSFLKGAMLINVEDIARMLLTLPNSLVIDFMKHHMHAFKKHCTAEGWHHYDDLSIIIAARQ